MGRRGWGCVAALLVGCVAEQAEESDVSGVVHIHGGDEAGPCQWPTVVALVDAGGSAGCSGTLIHPQFVVTAAHCIVGQGPAMVALGEDAAAPALTKPVAWCKQHPAHDATRGPAIDLAVCALESPVDGVQIVPPLQGCELDALRPGAATLIAGFGNTQSWPGGWPGSDDYQGEGAGLKRFIPQSVYEVRASWEEVDLVAIGSPGGGCHGDSGGGAFIQLGDGTWRLFGVAEALFDPELVPDPVPPTDDGVCGTGTTYSLLADRLAWIEHVTRTDVTPCFTTAGDWDPSPECGPLPLQPGYGHGTWEQSCQGPLGGELSCEPGPPAEPDPPQGSSSSDPSDGDASDDASGSSDGAEWGSTGEPSMMTDEAPDESPAEDVASTAGTQDAVGRACSVGRGGSGGSVLLLLLLAWRRRD